MGLLPARMRRLLVGGHSSHLAAVIDTLHEQGAMHIEDYEDPTGTTQIGTPLEAGDEASQQLVAVRGLQKAIGCQDAPAAALTADPAAIRADAEAATQGPLARVAALRAEAQALEAERSALTPLAGLELELSAVGTLHSVKVYAGIARTDPTSRIAALGIPHEMQVIPRGGQFAVLLVATTEHAPKCDKALAECAFAHANLPAGRVGTPDGRIQAIAGELQTNATAAAAAETVMEQMRATWGGRLAAAEARLAALVEKTQAPLRFGVTEATFHVEGWVPASQVNRVEAALKARFGEQLYLHDLGDAPREAHQPGVGMHGNSGDGHGHGHATAARGQGQGQSGDGHGHGHATAIAGLPAGNQGDAKDHDHHPSPTAAQEPPIHLENKGLAKPYQFLLGLLGQPRYKEVDPTILMLIFFPLFFGLMVGDVGVGILIMLVGFYLKTHKVFGIGGPAVGRSILMGGFMSAIVGLFVFGEAMGIHFVVDSHAAAAGELSWENILGLHIGDSGLLYKTGAQHLAEEAAGAITVQASGATGLKGILTPRSDTHLSLAGIVNLGYYSKVHDTMALLVWGILIGLVHVNLALAIGFRNVYVAHGLKLAIQEKGAWFLLQAGIAMAVLGSGFVLYAGIGLFVVAAALLWMGAAHVIGVGFIALLEIPGFAGTVLSYTRLAAIGASKAGMAIAFANIAFVIVGGDGVNPNTNSILGWVIYLAAFGLILVLAIIAGTLQSLRLQFVEFFGRFFAGGGRPYVPFGRRAN